ncbi:hypothetical protein [Vibrio splendidus]|uniref:hypothetical protein n=1 Tax=Vibrio splendidus TaxID=29497 RepID=UPI003D14F147
MKHNKTLSLCTAALSLFTLIGCSSQPDTANHDLTNDFDLSDQSRFKLFKEYSELRFYDALTEIVVNNETGQVVEKSITKEAENVSVKVYFDSHTLIDQYCIEETTKLDGFITDDDGYVSPFYVRTKKLVECPGWSLYKSIYVTDNTATSALFDETAEMSDSAEMLKPTVDDRSEVN